MSATETRRSDHPQPLLRRPWISLDGEWEFGTGRTARFDRTITVPFSPGTPLSGEPKFDPHAARFWYRRRVATPARPGRRTLLHFGAVDRVATVWVNGEVAGTHEGGYTPFVFDVTDTVAGDELEVVVRADDPPHDLGIPRGKQDWEDPPHSIWYPRTSGIWRTAWIEQVGATHVASIDWTGDAAAMAVTARLTIDGPLDGVRARLVLRHGDRVVGDGEAAVLSPQVDVRLAVGDGGMDDRAALIWWPRRPNLIDATVTLTRDGEVVDEAESYTALREVAVVDGRVHVNGQPVFLRLVLDQGYWPESGATPPDTAALRRDVELTLALGFNGARKHQKTEDPRYLALADELGLMVWVEMPSAYRPGRETSRRLLHEWAEVVASYRSHPSVIAWVPINESWGVPALAADAEQRATAEAMAAVARALDGTRPVSVNDGWETTGGDIVGIHDYSQDAALLARRYGDAAALDAVVSGTGPSGRRIDLDGRGADGRAVLLSEFGGVSVAGGGEGTWGYTTAASGDDLLERYTAQWAAVHASSALAGACWTQLTDVYQEANGLLRADRTPKAPLDELQAATRGRRRPAS